MDYWADALVHGEALLVRDIGRTLIERADEVAKAQ